MKRAVTVVALSAMLAAGFSGCGAGTKSTVPGDRIDGHTLAIYTSVPMNGASALSGASVVNGAQLALAQSGGRIGEYRIVLKQLDDSTRQRDEWDPGQTTINAKLAIRDPTTIGYIGEYNSGASAVSIPILNRFEIPQISPASTAVGLTSRGAGAAPGEPLKYYPTGVRTFARVMPNDAVQAAAQVALQRSLGCQKTYVVNDGEFDGENEASSFELVARSRGLNVVGVQSFQRGAATYAPFAASVAQSGADCVLIGAIADSDAVPVVRALAAAMPKAKLFGTAGLAESTFTDPRQGGLPTSLDSRILLTGPALSPGAYPSAARAFYVAYAKRAGLPQLSAIYGYEAMSLMLSAISQATDHGTDQAVRTKVLSAIFATRDRRSVLGTYSVDRNGDTTLRDYGVYKIVDGELRFWKSIDG